MAACTAKQSLTRARDHVLDEVVVAGAVGVRVVPLLRAVLDVRHVDGDAAVPLLGGVVYRAVILQGEAISGSALFPRGLRRLTLYFANFFSDNTLVMAADRVVLPWSTWPIVPGG